MHIPASRHKDAYPSENNDMCSVLLLFALAPCSLLMQQKKITLVKCIVLYAIMAKYSDNRPFSKLRKWRIGN